MIFSIVKFPLALGIAFFLLTATQTKGEAAITITFDGYPIHPPGSRYSRDSYGERQTAFSGNCGRAFPPSSTGWPENGTAYASPSLGMNCYRSGSAFALHSVDLAGYSWVIPDFVASFEGMRSDGTLVTTNFAVEGLEFTTYYFSVEFGNLTNVSMKAGALDNLKLLVPTVQPVMTVTTRTDPYVYPYNLWTVIILTEGTPGVRYRLEGADSLQAINWTNLIEFESGSYWYEFGSPTNRPMQRFFRVVQLP